MDAAHENDVPVIFTKVVYSRQNPIDSGLWPKKIPALRTWVRGSYPAQLDDRVHISDHDHVLVKPHASAFHGTELPSMLTAMGIDTVVITGCSTSGCVRATVSDASAHGFIPIIPGECVDDRSREQHQAHLWDIDSKFGDVRSKSKVLEYLSDV